MKSLTCILTLAALVQGVPVPEPHYTFPNIIGTAQWADVRQWTGYEGNGPVFDVTSTDIRCNKNGDKNFAKGTTSIAAGSTTGFNSNQAIFHYGPALAYLAKVPDGKTAATWDGSGTVWFKIFEEHPTVSNNQLNWPSYSILPIFTLNSHQKLILGTRCPKSQLQDPGCNSTRRVSAAHRAHRSASGEPVERSAVLYIMCTGHNHRQWSRHSWPSCGFPWRVQGNGSGDSL